MTQLPKTVTSRLAAMRSPEHPDPDLLTAFVESTLAGSERNRVLIHLSSCAECRQVASLALPEQITEERSPVAPRSASWLRAPVLRWGALAACVAVLVATVFMHRREASSPGQVQVAMEQAPAVPEANEIRKTAPAPAAPSTRRAMPEPALSKPKAKEKTQPPAIESDHLQRQLESSNRPATPPAPAASATAADSMQNSENVEVAAPAAAPPSAAADQPLRARNSMAKAAAPPFTTRPSAETAASTLGGAAAFADFRAPTWRLSTNNGLPQRSFGSGQWETVQVDHKAGFQAIAASGMEVWVGGAGGLLYHSADMGLNWTRIIPVSSNATLTDDVTAIAFSDHAHGQLTTARGQHWVTSDAGRTWEIH